MLLIAETLTAPELVGAGALIVAVLGVVFAFILKFRNGNESRGWGMTRTDTAGVPPVATFCPSHESLLKSQEKQWEMMDGIRDDIQTQGELLGRIDERTVAMQKTLDRLEKS